MHLVRSLLDFDLVMMAMDVLAGEGGSCHCLQIGGCNVFEHLGTAANDSFATLVDDAEPEEIHEQLPAAKTPERLTNDEEDEEDSPHIVFEDAEQLLALQEEAWATACLDTPAASELKGLEEDPTPPAPLLRDVAKELFGTMGEDAKLPAKQTKKKKKKKTRQANPSVSKSPSKKDSLTAKPGAKKEEPVQQPATAVTPPVPGIDAAFPLAEDDFQPADPPSDEEQREEGPEDVEIDLATADGRLVTNAAWNGELDTSRPSRYH
jgi:hypothetical protein